MADVNSKILDDMLECNDLCSPTGSYVNKLEHLTDYDKIDFFIKYLPALGYVRNQLIFYMFSNGLTTGSINEDVTLNSFLYATNREGSTNYAILQETISTAAVYGECGLKWYEGALYLVKPGTFAPVVRKVDGVDEIVTWLVTSDGSLISDKEIDLSKINLTEYTDFISYFEERKILVYSVDEFVSIRNIIEKTHGESPLLRDQLRLSLLVSVYQRLNYDVNYDGPGRLILKAKDGYVQSETGNEVSTTQVVNQSAMAQNNRYDKAKKEAAIVAKQIKESGSDSVIVLSNAFKDELKSLPRVTKATEFFNWIEQEGVILAQDLGMSPSLLELGKLSGNVSMEKIIDNSMLNTIIPLREKYAIQFSNFIAKKLGVSKVYFDKYELQQAESQVDVMSKYVKMIKELTESGQNELANDLASMVSTSIHDENNELIAMKVEKRGENHEKSEIDWRNFRSEG